MVGGRGSGRWLPQPRAGGGRDGAGSGTWEVQGFEVHRKGVKNRLVLWEEEILAEGPVLTTTDATRTPQKVPQKTQIWDQKHCAVAPLVP